LGDVVAVAHGGHALHLRTVGAASRITVPPSLTNQ